MSDLIRRVDVLEECVMNFGLRLQDIAQIPAVDAEPVKHGHWIKDSSGAEFCSECNQYPYDDGEYHIVNWHSCYCPNCGAEMRSE